MLGKAGDLGSEGLYQFFLFFLLIRALEFTNNLTVLSFFSHKVNHNPYLPFRDFGTFQD